MPVTRDPIRTLREIIGIRLDRNVDWEIISSVLEAGYRMVAPKRALSKLDCEGAG